MSKSRQNSKNKILKRDNDTKKIGSEIAEFKAINVANPVQELLDLDLYYDPLTDNNENTFNKQKENFNWPRNYAYSQDYAVLLKNDNCTPNKNNDNLPIACLEKKENVFKSKNKISLDKKSTDYNFSIVVDNQVTNSFSRKKLRSLGNSADLDSTPKKSFNIQIKRNKIYQHQEQPFNFKVKEKDLVLTDSKQNINDMENSKRSISKSTVAKEFQNPWSSMPLANLKHNINTMLQINGTQEIKPLTKKLLKGRTTQSMTNCEFDKLIDSVEFSKILTRKNTLGENVNWEKDIHDIKLDKPDKTREKDLRQYCYSEEASKLKFKNSKKI